MTGPSSPGFIQEARRRRVFSVAAVYIVGAFVALQVADLAFPGLSVPETAIQFVWIGALIGFPFALFFGWRYDLTDGRVLRTAAVDGESGSPIGRGDQLTLAIMTVALVAIIGIPLMTSEFVVGRLAQVSPVRALPELGGRKWTPLGWVD